MDPLECRRCGGREFEELIDGDNGSVVVGLVSLYADHRADLFIETLQRWNATVSEPGDFRCRECGYGGGSEVSGYRIAAFDEFESEVGPFA